MPKVIRKLTEAEIKNAKPKYELGQGNRPSNYTQETVLSLSFNVLEERLSLKNDPIRFSHLKKIQSAIEKSISLLDTDPKGDCSIGKLTKNDLDLWVT